MPATRPTQQGGSQAGAGTNADENRVTRVFRACRLTCPEAYLSGRAGEPMTLEPHRTTRQRAVNRSAEPAIYAAWMSGGQRQGFPHAAGQNLRS